MTAAIEAVPAMGAGSLLVMAAGVTVFLVWVMLAPDTAPPTWQPGELAAVALEVEPAGPGRHRVVAERACDTIATWAAYQARHSFAEVPPSVAGLAVLLPVDLRATVVARAVNPRWRPRPLTRAGLEAWGRKVARRHGVVCTLGRYRIAGSLP